MAVKEAFGWNDDFVDQSKKVLDIELKVLYNGQHYYEYKRNSTNTIYNKSESFTPIDSVKFKDYLQEAFEERLNEYNTLLAICHLNRP